MEYIYQKSSYQFLKKEEINKIFINEDSKENKEENLLKEKYGIIREKIAPFITSDNLNFLISNGCSIYTGSKGINNTTKSDLLSIIKNYEANIALKNLLDKVNFENLSPEKVLDKLFQISNFYDNIFSNVTMLKEIKNLIEEYKETLLKNYVLEINYKNPYLHEELLLIIKIM